VPATGKPMLKGVQLLTPNQRLLRAARFHSPPFGSNVRLIRRLVIQEKADVNARDSKGRTPLHLALKCNQLKNAHALLVLGADVMVFDNSGNMTLNYLHSGEKWSGFAFARLMMAYAYKGGNEITIDNEREEWIDHTEEMNQDNRKMAHLSDLIQKSLDTPQPLVTSMYLDRLINMIDRTGLHRVELMQCYLDPLCMDSFLKMGIKLFRESAKKALALCCASDSCVSAAHAASSRALGQCVALDKLRMDLLQLPRSHARFAACAHCAKPARVKHCSACMQAAYCSVACQASAWPRHKSGCVAPREELD
jgi:hypothetical protein